VFGGELEDRALDPVGPSGQHSLCTRVQLNTGWVCQDGIVAAVVGMRDGCPVVLPLDEDVFLGGGDGEEVIEVGNVTIMDSWAATYVFPSYCSDPDSLPTHLDCHEVTYAD
jgi:hypothetical protein